MAFKIADLVAEATGVNPVKFNTTFADSPLTYPDQAVQQPEMPEPTTAKKTVEKAPEKATEDTTEKSSSATPAAQGHLQQDHDSSEPVIKSEPNGTVAKPAAAKRHKASRIVRKPKATLPKTAKTGEADARNEELDGGPEMTTGQQVEDSEGKNGGASKKRTFDEFEITADTDIGALAALGRTPVLEHAEASLEVVKIPATKKVKTNSGKGTAPLTTKMKSTVKAKHSDGEVEHISAKKPTNKAVSRSALKTKPADAKVKKPAAAKKTHAPKKAAATKKLEKALAGVNGPGRATKLTPAQIAARKVGNQ
ncbi:hypothetical protein SLS60_000391 [Paraconiothyrium brasiliense]|uniref:Uncharacterized protein n=1 Tax=Paraconiothyrium brasiliense TaxID=300254 RepID=A0ABR3S653_9PLEO